MWHIFRPPLFLWKAEWNAKIWLKSWDNYGILWLIPISPLYELKNGNLGVTLVLLTSSIFVCLFEYQLGRQMKRKREEIMSQKRRKASTQAMRSFKITQATQLFKAWSTSTSHIKLSMEKYSGSSPFSVCSHWVCTGVSRLTSIGRRNLCWLLSQQLHIQWRRY